MSGGHQYECANISGQATAILGNKYGDVVNIQQATFLLQATRTTPSNNGPSRIVRHNRVLPGGQTTVESIKTYNEADHFRQRGAVEEIELTWERTDDLGVGSFGEAHREECNSYGQVKSRAVKVLRRRHLRHMGVDHKKELDALIDLSQPNFVHRFVEFYSWYESHDNIYLAMEYVPHGDLEMHVQAGLNELDARQIAYQILDGMRIMHELDLSHRDIKPANIFVVQKEPVWWVKLGDFSICKRSMTRQTILRTQVGTQGYQAPEVLGLIETEKKDMYDSKCDLWSFGCLVFEMLTKQLPFPDLRTLNAYCNDDIEFPGLLIKDAGGSLLFAEFAWSMLQVTPCMRPTSDQAMFLLSYRSAPTTRQEDSIEYTNPLYLTDCVGRHFRIPWKHCSKWLDMQSTLKTLLSYIKRDGIGERVSRGFYELRNSQGLRLHSCNWERVASPGMHISVSMLPGNREGPPLQDSPSNCLEHAPRRPPMPEHSMKHRNPKFLLARPYQVLTQAATKTYGIEDGLDEARIMQEILDEGLLGEIDVDSLTEAEQDLLAERIAELYRQRHPRPGTRSDGHETGLASALTNTHHERSNKPEKEKTCIQPAAKVQHSNASPLPLQPPGCIPISITLEAQQNAEEDFFLNTTSPNIEKVHGRVEQGDSTGDSPTTVPDDASTVVRDKELSYSTRTLECLTLETASRQDTNPHAAENFTSPFEVENVLDMEDHRLPTLISPEHNMALPISEPFHLPAQKTNTLSANRYRHFDIEGDAEPVRMAGWRGPPRNCPSQSEKSSTDLPVTSMVTDSSISDILLVDWHGNVHYLSQTVCRDWPTTEATISNCFVGDVWHPMIERGYYDLAEGFSRRVFRPWEQPWEREWSVKFLYGKTIQILPWSDAWIFSLPPQVSIEQFTKSSHVSHAQPHTPSHDRENVTPINCICFTTRSGYAYNIPFSECQTWKRFARYISRDAHGQERLSPLGHGTGRIPSSQWYLDGFDLFVLELRTILGSKYWHRLLPGMHIYELLHPRCSVARAALVATTADLLLRRIESEEMTQIPIAGTTTSVSRDHKSPSPKALDGKATLKHRKDVAKVFDSTLARQKKKAREESEEQRAAREAALAVERPKERCGSREPEETMAAYAARVTEKQRKEQKEELRKIGKNRPAYGTGIKQTADNKRHITMK